MSKGARLDPNPKGPPQSVMRQHVCAKRSVVGHGAEAHAAAVPAAHSAVRVVPVTELELYARSFQKGHTRDLAKFRCAPRFRRLHVAKPVHTLTVPHHGI
jgi:hypothetical protein